MRVLTLTTDWGVKDPAVSSLKGAVLSRHIQTNIIDITHFVEKFDILNAAVILKTAYAKFPKGTIHYIGLSAQFEEPEEFAYKMVESDGHIFFGFDSGIFSLILDSEAPKRIFLADIPRTASRREKAMKEEEILGELLSGKHPKEIGKETNDFIVSHLIKPSGDSSSIKASIMYIDSFGNAVLNVTRQLFEKERNGRRFVINMPRRMYTIDELSNDYDDVSSSEIVAFFNSTDHLEIALNNSTANTLVGLKLMDTVRIDFE